MAYLPPDHAEQCRDDSPFAAMVATQRPYLPLLWVWPRALLTKPRPQGKKHSLGLSWSRTRCLYRHAFDLCPQHPIPTMGQMLQVSKKISSAWGSGIWQLCKDMRSHTTGRSAVTTRVGWNTGWIDDRLPVLRGLNNRFNRLLQQYTTRFRYGLTVSASLC